MVKDFGFTRRSRWSRPREMVSLYGGLAAVACIVAAAMVWSHQEDQARTSWARTELQRWAATGTPCPTVPNAEQAAVASQIAKRFTFIQVGFGRRSGNVSCAGVADSHGRWGKRPVCQFNNPEAVRVVTSKGVFLYGPQLYRPVTVTVRDGAPQCVINRDYAFND